MQAAPTGVADSGGRGRALLEMIPGTMRTHDDRIDDVRKSYPCCRGHRDEPAVVHRQTSMVSWPRCQLWTTPKLWPRTPTTRKRWSLNQQKMPCPRASEC